jgi:hypothetical protein
MTGCMTRGFFLRIGDRRQRWRRSLVRHEITNTIVRSDLVVGHASPFTAVTRSTHSWCELPSLGDVRHAVGLEKVEVGTGINGAETRGWSHVCGLVCAYVLSNSHVVRLITGAAAGFLGGTVRVPENVTGWNMLAPEQAF